MENKIFMCFVEGSRGTNHIHDTQESAETEADRLSGLPENTGKKVYVLASVAERRTEKEENNA